MSMKKIFRSLLGAAMLVAASLQAYAQDTMIFDQQSTNVPVSPLGNGNADGLYIQTEPLTQSFIPTNSAIGFVQFEFEDVPGNGNSGATVYVNLWTGSPNVNSATFISSTAPVYMPNGFVNDGLGVAGVTNFYFSTLVALTSGQTYYLQPVVLSGDNPWAIVTIGNTYPNGQVFASGDGFNTDMWFREGIVSTPEPSTLALIGLSGFFIFVRKRFRSLLIVSQVQYSIAIDNDYWLYLNHSTNYIDMINHDGPTTWSAFKSFQSVSTNLLHYGTNDIGVVIRDRGDINYFSMVVTTNTCGQ
jgi:hypothetical protein